MKTKRILILLLAALTALCLFSCKRDGDDPKDNNYPDGAIAITEDNLATYFDIKVTTKCQYDYDYEVTRVSSYVALVPKGEYRKIVGEITFELNSRVRQYGLANGNWRVSSDTHKLRLSDSGMTNTEIKTSVQGGGNTVTVEFVPIKENDNITLKTAVGYIMLGEKKPQEHELITNNQRLESPEILAELKERVESFKELYDSAESFNYNSRTEYELGSLYGAALSKSGATTHNGVNVDYKNDRFKIGNTVHYKLNGISVQQSLDPSGCVNLSKSGMSLDLVLGEYPPVWEIFDTGAVYMKESDNTYVAITTLYNMSDGVFKQRLISALSEYGITTRHNRMTVKYVYAFDEGSFYFGAAVDYTDLQYDVDYVNIHAEALQKISDVNNTAVELYDPQRYLFLPAKSLEDAMELGAAQITLERGQESFTVTTFSDSYEGYYDTVVKRYFPLVIEESGVYSFTPEAKTIVIYNSDGRAIYTDGAQYFSRGTYYLCVNSVLYGRNDRRFAVSATYLEDYGDVNNPTPVENGEYTVRLETVDDRVAFSFTPSESGIYSLLKYDNVTLYLYSAADTATVINEIWATDHYAMLTANETYILLLEYRGDGSAEFVANIEYVGAPTIPEDFTLTEEWQDVFLWWDGVTNLPVTITEPGEYYVQLEWIAGQQNVGGSFYTSDGKYYNLYKYVYIDGAETKITQLDAGEYYLDVDVYANMYFKGRVRLVTYAKRVVEESDIEIPTDSYVTITTSDLATTFSTSTFSFEVTEDSVLYWTTDSDFFAIYDENGKRISTYANTVFDAEHQIWVEYSGKLTAGTYTIVFTIDEYAKPGVKTADVRLEPD